MKNRNILDFSFTEAIKLSLKSLAVAGTFLLVILMFNTFFHETLITEKILDKFLSLGFAYLFVRLIFFGR